MARPAPVNGLRSDLFWLAEEKGTRLPQTPLDELLIQADFGRKTRGRWALRLASHARWVLAIFVGGLLLLHLPLVQIKLPVFLALGGYLLYLLVRPLLSAQLDKRFSTPDEQAQIRLMFASFLLLAVGALLAALAMAGDSIGVLWLLYLPPLAAISFSSRQRFFWIGLLGAAIVTAGLSFFELRSLGLSNSQLIGEVGSRAVALVTVGFLVHYFVRGAMLWEQGTTIRTALQRWLMERLIVEIDYIALWVAVRDACAVAINATRSDIYLYEYGTPRSGRKERLLQPIVEELSKVSDMPDWRLGRPLKNIEENPHIAAQAIRDNALVEREIGTGLFEVAAPIYGHPRSESIPLAVVVLLFEGSSHESAIAASHLSEFLGQIWPVATYASIRFSAKQLHRLEKDLVIQSALDTICDKLGFEFATISLVDDDRQEIRCVAGRNVSDEWVADAHHPLCPTDGEREDIQAEVIRTGKTKQVGPGWDNSFDPTMYEAHGHADLIRLFLPLGGTTAIGTIEAGVRQGDGGSLHKMQIAAFERYGQLNVTPALRNALLHERLKDVVDELNGFVDSLNRLHMVIFEWQTDPQPYSDVGRLTQIAEAAHASFGADLVMVYPYVPPDARAPSNNRFGKPICFPPNALKGDNELKPPMGPNNIIHLVEAEGPYYAPDTSDVLWRQDSTEGADFITRQKIRSFAGVPLLARGEFLGVLCLNYRNFRALRASEQRMIELFTQQAAALITSHHSLREQERLQFKQYLHDVVEANAMTLYNACNHAKNNLPDDQTFEYAIRQISRARDCATAILFGSRLTRENMSSSTREQSRYPLDDLLELVLKPVITKSDSDQSADLAGPNVTLSLGTGLPTLSQSHALAAMCIAHQAVHNALRHAEATYIRTEATCTGGQLRITVTDDGTKGFNPRSDPGPTHNGIRNMRKLANEIAADLEIYRRNGPEMGTVVQLTIPLEETPSKGEARQVEAPVP